MASAVVAAMCTGSLCGASGTAADTIRNRKELRVMQQSVIVATLPQVSGQGGMAAKRPRREMLAGHRTARNHKITSHQDNSLG